MNEHDDVICQVRESFSGLRMDTGVDDVFARSRARRRRRLSGLTAAIAVTAAAAAATTLTLGGPAPARSANSATASRAPASTGTASHGPVTLAAYSVSAGPGPSTTLTVRKGQRLDPAALREDLARHGIPALVTIGTFCRSTPAPPGGIGQVLQPSTLPDGSAVLVINGPAMPSGTKLSIGYFQGHVQMGLIEDGARLSCGTTSGQPAVHVTQSNTPIRTLPGQ